MQPFFKARKADMVLLVLVKILISSFMRLSYFVSLFKVR